MSAAGLGPFSPPQQRCPLDCACGPGEEAVRGRHRSGQPAAGRLVEPLQQVARPVEHGEGERGQDLARRAARHDGVRAGGGDAPHQLPLPADQPQPAPPEQLLHAGEQLVLLGADVVIQHREGAFHGYSRPGLKEVSLLRLQMSIYNKFFVPRLFWMAMRMLNVLSKTGLFIASSSQEELLGAKPAGYEKRMSEFQALRGVIELSQLGDNLVSREQLADRYSRLLRESGLKPVTIPPGSRPVLLRYPLLVKNKPAVLAEAQRRAIEIGSWFDSVLHPSGSPLKTMGYLPGQCPVAERVVQHMVNLPLHRRVSEYDALRVVDFIKEMRERAYV